MRIITIILFILITTGCTKNKEIKSKDITNLDKKLFIQAMQKHLDAVTNRDLETLKSTLSAKTQMQLILPKTEIFKTTQDFIDYHQQWFALPDWTFETEILNTRVGRDLGMAIVEIVYREPNRDGKPYFNRMNVSYVLEKLDDQWFVIKDHASSVEKSTD